MASEQRSTVNVRYRAALGRYGPSVAAGLEQAAREGVARRIWQRDVTLWPGAPESKHLGWLKTPERIKATLEPLQTFTDEVRAAGFKRVLLLGVGAPNLALELVRTVFGSHRGYLSLDALASTDADAVLAHARNLGPETLLIVSDKTGGALETRSLFQFFYSCVEEQVGRGAGRRFVAVGNPGDPLAALAKAHGFRAAFFNDPDVPGCYAALALCGLLPLALAGVDPSSLQRYALAGAAACAADLPADNAGVWLGTVLGVLAKVGRDKVTFVLPPALTGLGGWLERLLAEATGKAGVGVVPLVGEPLGAPEVYGDDRVFVHLTLGDDAPLVALGQLEAAGHPVLHLELESPYDVLAQLFVWQFGAAVAAYHLGVNPFGQPDVATADARTQTLMTRYRATHTVPDEAFTASAETLGAFLADVQPGDYVALQAYLPPSPEVRAGLEQLCVALRDRLCVAVTSAFGPQYLHSTGQLHKGGKNNGHFVQLVSEPRQNALIPDRVGERAASTSFYVLKRAQALGDKQALEAAGRRVIQFNLGQRGIAGLGVLSHSL